MHVKIASLVAFFVFTFLVIQPVQASVNLPYLDSFGMQGLVKSGVFTFPQYVAVDDSSNFYVTDLGNARVQKFDKNGEFLTSWGSKGMGNTEFHAPTGIAVGSGYVYVSDHELSFIKKFDLNGNFITSWGQTGSDVTKLKLPSGVAVSNDNFVYVVDTGNSRVVKFDSDGKFVSIIGSSGKGDGQFLTPLDVVVDSSGNIFVSDSGNNRIQKFNVNGGFVAKYSPSIGGIKISPDGIALDSSGNIMISDSGNNRIVVLDSDGKSVTSFGKTGMGNSQFKLPKGIAINSNGDLFVVDSNNHRIEKFGNKETTTVTQTVSTPVQTKPIIKTVDLKKPIVTPPKDLYVEATGGLTRVSIGQAIATDESGIQSLTNNAPEQFPLGITTVIWTAIDNAGNMGIATQTVTVGDSTPPVISGLSDVTIEANGNQNTPNLGNPTVNDLVGVLSITNDAPASFPLGKTVVTWTATDVAKNIATATQIVTVQDTKPPKIRAPATVTYEASSLDQNFMNLGEPTVTDNSEIASVTNDAPQGFPIGETIVTWIAIDTSGNQASATQKVEVVDTIKPVISKIADLTVEATSDKQNTVNLVAPNVTDVQKVIVTSNAPTFFQLGKTMITWTAVDASGNNSTINQTISLVDTTAPTLTVPTDVIKEATTKTGNSVSLGDPVATDLTGIPTVTNNAPSDYPLGTTIVTWTATDNFGNSVSKTQNVTIVDTTKPIITAPAKVVFEAVGTSGNVVPLGEPKTYDVVEVASVTNDAPQSFGFGDTTVTWTVTDTSGNSATSTQVVSVIDTTAPVITTPSNIVQEATGKTGTSLDIGKAEVTDLIKVENITNDAPSSFPLGNTTVTWTATDESGNTSTATQIITIQDTTKPTITAPADITLEATSASENTVNLGDAKADDTVSLVSVTNDAPKTFPIGETTVTWTATDSSGNISNATQKVTIADTTKPTITAPADITQEATSKSDNKITLQTPTVVDNVEVASITNDAPESFPVGITTVTWTATDSSGLISSVQQKVSVVDTTKPEIHVKDISVEATSEDKNAVDIGSPNTFDLVEVVSLTNDAPNNFKLGVTLVTWTARDAAGNTATAIQSITVRDTTKPTLTAPTDVIFEATSATENVVSLGNPESSDAVSNVIITNDAPKTFPIGETTVTWTATDSSGNISNATQKVTIADTTKPTITAPADITQEATSKSDNKITLQTPTVVDNVEVASITNDAPESFPVGITTVTWTATDDSGNYESITQKITVIDSVPPKFDKLSDITVEATSKGSNSISIPTPKVSDIQDITKLENDAPKVFALGETTVTWTAIDESGNTSTTTQKVIVQDTTKPTITPPADITQEATSSDSNTVSLGKADASDLVEIATVSNDAPSKFKLGETIVSWTATDSSGNIANVTQKVIIIDTSSPNISKPDNVVVEATSKNDTVVTLQPPMATDSVSKVTITNDAPKTFPLGDTLVTWTAKDEAGNRSNVTQTITIKDSTAPELAIPDNVITNATDLNTVISFGNANATDLTDSSPKITNDAPDAFPIGETKVTWTVVDSFGNMESKTQTITVQACGKPESAYNVVLGTDGDDILTGTSKADLIIGLAGDDIITGDKGDDCILSGDGDDIVYGNEGTDYVNAGSGNDIIKGGSGDDYLITGAGTDVVDGGDDYDTCIASNDNDILLSCEN